MNANLQEEVDREIKRAQKVAELVWQHTRNDKGEKLANVYTSQGFQEVWDYKGSDKKRLRLDRKME